VDPEVHYLAPFLLPLVPFTRQLNPLNTFQPRSFEMHFSILCAVIVMNYVSEWPR